ELRELGAQAKQFLRGKAILRQSARCCGENLGKINDRVARDRKCKLSLSGAGFLNSGYRQGAGVEYSGEGRDPGLVVMLGAEVREHGIREMAFHKLRAPELPILQQGVQRRVAIRVTVAAKEFTGGGRRAGTRIEKRDVDLAFGEGAVDKREVADHGGEKAETETSFSDDQKPGKSGARNYVAESQREEGGSTEIKVRVQAGDLAGEIDGGACAVLHHAERKNQSNGPKADQKEQRDGTVETQKRLAPLA